MHNRAIPTRGVTQTFRRGLGASERVRADELDDNLPACPGANVPHASRVCVDESGMQRYDHDSGTKARLVDAANDPRVADFYEMAGRFRMTPEDLAAWCAANGEPPYAA